MGWCGFELVSHVTPLVLRCPCRRRSALARVFAGPATDRNCQRLPFLEALKTNHVMCVTSDNRWYRFIELARMSVCRPICRWVTLLIINYIG